MRSRNSFPSQFRYDVNDSTGYTEDNTAISNLFADYFESTYSDKSLQCYNTSVLPNLDIFNLDISIGEVFNCINSLQLNSVSGLDGIPSIFLHSCKFIMARALWLIYNKSLSCGDFPGIWKTSVVTPIFKGGDGSLVSNYRPISKQNVIPKMFENIVAGKLALLCKNAILDEQHGFISGRSVTSNLLTYHDFISMKIEAGSCVDAIYTDFKKAFDSVNHSLLIDKLRFFGFGGTFLEWVKNFIIGRVQVVKYKNALSRDIIVISGVPQGSHLGPLL